MSQYANINIIEHVLAVLANINLIEHVLAVLAQYKHNRACTSSTGPI